VTQETSEAESSRPNLRCHNRQLGLRLIDVRRLTELGNQPLRSINNVGMSVRFKICMLA